MMNEAQADKIIMLLQTLNDSMKKQAEATEDLVNLFKKYEVDESLLLEANREG